MFAPTILRMWLQCFSSAFELDFGEDDAGQDYEAADYDVDFEDFEADEDSEQGTKEAFCRHDDGCFGRGGDCLRPRLQEVAHGGAEYTDVENGRKSYGPVDGNCRGVLGGEEQDCAEDRAGKQLDECDSGWVVVLCRNAEVYDVGGKTQRAKQKVDVAG